MKQGTSALPRCFNYLLCDAANHARNYPVTHLAMLHDDVGPDGDDWLDVLLDEMERTGADMVSAVVPIKDTHGLTSTAVDNPDDPWVVRRLTLREVFALPETFAAADVPWNADGGCLLANTGCWVARFDLGWIEPFLDPARRGDGQSGFRFLNRVIKDPSGDYVGQDIPEDWDFARQMHALGRRVVCTRKVPLAHGHPLWHNRCVWGDWPTDLGFLEYRRRLVEGATPPEGWRFPGDVPGWLTQGEGEALAALATGRDVLEIGSYCGRSTVCMAQTAASLVAVDPFDGRATAAPRDTLPVFMENLSRYGVLSKVKAVVGTAESAVPDLAERFDLAFIDGAHNRAAVLGDAAVATRALKPGGLLVFHDYGRPVDPGVTAAVGELLAAGAKLLDVTETVAVVQP